MPSKLGEDQNAYPVAYIAHELDKKGLLVDSPEYGTSIRRAVTDSIFKFLYVPGVDDINMFRVEWATDLDNIHGLEARKFPIGRRDLGVVSTGALSLRVEDEPELFCVGKGIQHIEEKAPGVGKAVWAVVDGFCRWVFNGMTPGWAYDRSIEWEQWNEEQEEELEDDEVERDARAEDGPLDGSLEDFQQPDEDFGLYHVSPRHFQKQLPEYVWNPKKINQRTVSILNKAIDTADVEYIHIVQTALELARLITRRKNSGLRNRLYEYACDEQYPGFAVCWRPVNDPSTRVFDEHIDLLRQRYGEVENNVFVAPFAVPLPANVDEPVEKNPFGEALERMQQVLCALVGLSQLLHMLEAFNSPRQEVRIRI